jgi:UDP-glucose 4-epimerase
MKNKRILITGSRGFIGSHLVKALANQGHTIIEFDSKLEKDIFSSDLEIDIQDVDVVIHLAALTSVDQSFKNPAEVFRVNVLGTARVVDLCAKYKKKLIFPSSAAVYHPELSPYAWSKLLGEQIVQGMKDAIPTVVFRLYNVYGPDMNPNSGSIMYNFLTSKELIVFGDGEQTRDFIHVRDVVSIICDAVASKRYDGAIFDVGTGEAYSTNYIAGLFSYMRVKDIEYKTPRREIKWSTADTQLLKRLYKKPLTTNLEKDIKELVNYYHEN